MRFPSSALTVLLLLASDNGTSAYLHSTTSARMLLQHSMVQDGASSSPLPPSLHGSTPPSVTNGAKQHARRKRNPRKQSSWEGREIPKDIRKLSDIIKDATVDDFAGEIAVTSSSPQSTNRPRRNGKARNDNNRHSKDGAHRRSDNAASEIVVEPWRANYRVSTQTQARIKGAAARGRTNADKATGVLKTLLTTPPHKCNEANVVCALTLSAKAMLPSTRISQKFRSMLMQTLEVLRELVADHRLNARQLCNAVWAIAKHYNGDPTILPCPPEMTPMSSEEMLGVAEAWILQGENDVESAEKHVKETIDMIATQLTDILENESTRKPKVGELCMASWAYGVLIPRCRPPGWTVPPQIGRIPNSRQRKRRDMEFVTFEQWAQEDDEEDGQVVGIPVDCIDQFFDAVGDALCSPEETLEDEWVQGPPLVESCTWSEIANVAWAYATHGYCRTPSSEAAIRALAQEATRRLHESQASVKPRDVAQMVWSVGTLQSDNFRLANDLVELADAIADHWQVEQSPTTSNKRPFQRWSCPDLVQLAISLAHGRIDQQPLLRAVYQEALYRLNDSPSDSYSRQGRRITFRTWEVSVLLWAQARLYLHDQLDNVYAGFASEAPKWLYRSLRQKNGDSLETIGFGQQEQANLAWSLTVLQQYHSEEETNLLKAIFQETSASSKQSHVIQLEHAHQLWQALYILERECPSAVEHVPGWFREYLQEKWSLEKARRKKSSARHRSLSDTLSLMNVAHYNEHDEDIDVAIVLREDASWTHQTTTGSRRGRYKVAVEFDGPNHFTREIDDGTRQRPRALGHTVLKYRLLKLEGWTVVRVPYYEFDKIPFWASMERQRYLQRLLKTHANIRFSDVDRSEYSAPMRNRQSRFD